ncbi:LamG-like jellyroll fold domain-containing protein [Nonomuraea wenchangensis]
MNARRLALGLSTRTRRPAALIAALTLPLSLMTAPAIAQGPTPPPATASETTAGTTEPTLKAAWDQAAKTGKPVEVPAHSTETMKVWANPDGKNMRAELHTRPVQLKNAASGAWEPIDTRIVTRDGKLQATRVKTPLTFGGRGAKQLVSAPGKHGEIGLGVTRALPEPKVSGDAVTYPDAVAPGADLVVLAQADGFISQVVFRQRPAGPVTVRLPLTLPEGTTFGKTPQGLPQLKDAKGEAKAAPIVLTATDAKVEAAPEQGRTSSVKAQVETTGKTSELVFTPDEKFLADPAVTYPVTVAASSTWFGGGAPDDAWISKNDPYNNNSAAGYLRAGTTSTSADVARVYLKFNTSDPVLQGATVNDADLRMWNYKSGGPNGQLCGDPLGTGIRAARVTGEWTLDGTVDSLDWYNQPSSTAPETVNRAGYNYDADPATWCAKDEELFYEVTAMTRAWIDQTEPNHGIVLKAASETAAINWRQYYSSQFGGGNPYPGYRHPPALIIDYTPAQEEIVAIWGMSPDSPTADVLEAATSAVPVQAPPAVPREQMDAAALTGDGYTETNPEDMVLPEGLTPEQIEEFLNGPRPTEPPAPPSVVSTSPANSQTNVAINNPIKVTFSEPVVGGDIAVTSSQGAPVAGNSALEPGDQTLTFTPDQPLATDTTYTATVSGARNYENVTVPQYTWSFTTGVSSTDAPIVTGTEPSRDATNVSVGTAVKVIFDKAVSEVQLTIKDQSDAIVQGTLTGSNGNAEWTFTPASRLAAQKTYRVDVSGAKDSSGNVMAPYTWSFTTAADTSQPTPGLVAAYGMNEGTGTSVADSSGRNNAGVAAATSWQNGKYGKALSFNGSSSMVTVAHAASLRLTTGMTLSAWVNPTTVTGTAWRSVVTKELSASGASYALYAANGGTVPSGWVQTDPESSATADGLSPLPVNGWSHLALTYDGAALRLFVNGQQIDQTALSGSLYDDGSPLRIGGNVVWSEYFSGLIDEVRIYNRAQSAAEIQTDMTTPIGGAAPPDTQAPTAPGSLTATGGPGSAQLTWTASTDNVGVTGYRVHRSTTPGFTPSAANQVGSVTATTFADGGLAAGTYYYRVLATDAAGNLSPSSNEVSAAVTAPPATPGLVAAYGMNEGAGTTVGDSSGKNNTGAGTDTTWANGKHGKALSFNGTSSWVTVPHAQSLRLTNALTLSAWVRPATVDAWRTVLMKENAFGPAYGLYAAYDGAPLGWLQNATTFKTVVGDDPLPINQWSHLAVTYNGTIITLYLNGTQIDQTPMTGNLADDGGVLRLGGNNIWLDEFYSGLIDEVRIYNRVQTAAEIQADMNAPIGAAATSTATQQQRLNAATDPAPAIDKLTVDGGRTADGATLASTLTPRLTTWLSAGRDGEAKVEVEIAGKPTKSAKAGKVRTDRRLIWSGEATARPGETRVSLQVPEGKLRDGEKARWRARATADGVNGPWTGWQPVNVRASAGESQPTTQSSATSPNRASTYSASNFKYDRIKDNDDCKSNARSAYGYPSGSNVLQNPKGYARNRFSWCATYMSGLVRVKRNRFGDVVKDAQGRPATTDEVWFPQILIGRTYQGSRTIEFDLWVDEAIHNPFKGDYFKGKTFAIGMMGTGYPNGNACLPVTRDGLKTSYIGNEDYWDDRTVHFKFESYVDSGSAGSNNRELIGTCTTRTTLHLIGLNGYEEAMAPPKQSIRCDSANYVGYAEGCIFDHETPSIALKESIYPNAYSHISLAYSNPNATHPKPTDHANAWPTNVPEIRKDTPKVIPGFTKGRVIHRLYQYPDERAQDGNRNARNRSRSQSACRWSYFPTWSGTGQAPWVTAGNECDEFPFASTYEGSWVWWQENLPNDAGSYRPRGVNYSVKPIPAAENGAWGGAAQGGILYYYAYDRMLDGDAFFLRLYNRAGTRINP